MKFSDVILGAAAMAVVWSLIYVLFALVLIPSAGSVWGLDAAAGISLLIAALVVGAVFAGKMEAESRARAFGKVAVLFGVVTLFLSMMLFSSNSNSGNLLKETLQGMYSTGSWTTADWFAYTQLAIFLNVAVNVALSLVVGFIGLYVGSLLRKPKQG